MPRVILRDFNLGGMADSLLQGKPNSLYRIKGIDLHAKPGILRLSQALTKESGATVDDRCDFIVNCSNGETYLFGSGNNAGKVFRRKSDATWELAYTTVPAAGNADCLGAIEYKGYVIWATSERLHRITTANALTATWSVLDLNWQTVTSASFHPMLEVNLNLYIGNGSAVALWDGTTFTSSKLAINTPHVVSALGKTPDGYQLLIGTYIASTVSLCKVYRWNTWSQNFSADDDIPEVGVNCFLPVDNLAVIQAGVKGNLYYYSADAWVKYARIPGTWTAGNKAKVRDGSAVNSNGTVLFGVSNVSGNPCDQGVYELGSYGPDYPLVIHQKHIISSTNVTNVQMGGLALIGDRLLASWTDAGVGVDIESTTAKTGIGSIETRALNGDRDSLKVVNVKVCFLSRPTGTGITMYADKGAGYSSVTFRYDDRRLMAQSSVKVADAPYVNFKFEVVGSSNSTPEIDQIIIDW